MQTLTFNRIQIFLFLILFCLVGCTSENSETTADPTLSGSKLFSSISPQASSVHFSNNIVESAQINYFSYVYLYNGGGVGLGDINNDGLPDLYLTSTQGTDKLYLNKGNFEFEDISTAAGIDRYSGYKSGVTFVDINSDGWTDIYVCRSGWSQNPKEKENLLFINNTKNGFVEAASSYGLNSQDQSVQSVFFDYDRDGDLDMYLANHPEKFQQPIQSMVASVKNLRYKDTDRLYRNNGDGSFSDVTKEAGLANFSYSLGVVASDLNNDGWIDLYVTSDFQPRDNYYVNNGDGTFTESLQTYFPHCSYFSMGVDVVDLNGDGYNDVFTGEMLAEDNQRQKTQMAPMNMQRFADMVNNGMHFQYMRNSLHLNNGNGYFSDIAHYLGIDKSDWSWSVLFDDYDQDGDDDLLVANGWLKDTQDKDYTTRSGALARNNNNQLTFEQAYSLLKSTPVKNYAFKQTEDLKFEKTSDEWGFNMEGFSNGMASADLDGDGDLDVVVNNINSKASIYKNNANNTNYLSIKLNGPAGNKKGYNSKIEVSGTEKTYFKEVQVTRGFQSSCTPIAHIGLKPREKVNSIKVTWPDGKVEVLSGIEPGLVTVDYKQAKTLRDNTSKNHLFKESNSLAHIHKENYFDDYSVQVLLPHLLSQLGPALAKGDVNGDGLEDVYVGGAAGQAGKILLQTTQGQFTKGQVFGNYSAAEETEALFFDANNNGILDLYIGTASNQYGDTDLNNTDRLYINDGKGNFTISKELPDVINQTGAIAAGDYDGDGDLDLFIGGRLSQAHYPNAAPARLLRNDKGQFVDLTETLSGELQLPGMITDAEWTDYDDDGDLDLMLVGEWTDILIYDNNDGQLTRNRKAVAQSLVGWWNSIEAADIDGDGDIDYVLGNLGENYKYQASAAEPFEIFAGDFDNSGVQDIVLSYYNDEELYPVRGFQCSSEQMPSLKKKISTYEDFGQSDVFKVYGAALDEALHYKANCFSSMILWNVNGKLSPKKLPYQAQLSPLQSSVIEDIDGDGDLDIVTAGNWYVAEVETPRADAGVGTVLINEGGQNFKAMPSVDSGFFANRDVRNMVGVKGAQDKFQIIIGNNNSAVQVFELR